MPSAQEEARRRRDLRRRPNVLARLGLLAIVPLVGLGVLGIRPVLDARQAYVASGSLASLLTRDVAVEELRVQVAYERSLTGALINLRKRPVPGLDEKAIEQKVAARSTRPTGSSTVAGVMAALGAGRQINGTRKSDSTWYGPLNISP